MNRRVSSVIVLGGGSAGFMAALALKKTMPNLKVQVIRSRDIGIIGVGEGSTPILVQFLHKLLQVPLQSFFEKVRPTWKLGLKFIWGPRPAFHYTFGQQVTQPAPGLPGRLGNYCMHTMEQWEPHAALMSLDKVFVRDAAGKPIIHTDLSYHFENERFVTFLENFATSMGIEICEETVAQVTQDEAGISGLAMKSGLTYAADLYVDCSGFVSLLVGQTLGEPFISFKSSLFCDRAVVGGWARTDEPIKPYTTCETMNTGWAWQIEHENRINRGYVYCSAFISDADAEAEFRRKNPKVGPTRVVRFVAGRYQRGWVKNVVAIGNSYGFVEPLEATALGAIASQIDSLVSILYDADREIRPTYVQIHNTAQAEGWDSIRGFIAMHYKFNQRLDTPFWQASRHDVDLAKGKPLVEYYLDNGPAPYWSAMLAGNSEVYHLPDFATLMIGQKIPWRHMPVPGAAEQARWEALRQAHLRRAQAAMTVKEALAATQAPDWDWSQAALDEAGFT
jgi:tryptophan 7-halogenase